MKLLFDEGFSFSGYERNSLFLSLQGESFKDISGVSGLDSLQDGRAVTLADFDNDGDHDVFVTNIQGEGHLLFRNNIGQDNSFLRVSLEGTSSGKDAFGAMVRVKTSLGIQTGIKSGGSGFLAHHDPRLLFDLGEVSQVESIEITWPSGKLQRLGPVRAGLSIRVVEGVDEFHIIDERAGRLADPLSPEETLWRRLKISRNGELPGLAFRSLDGEEGSLKKGNAYLVNFWATWCIPCRREMPELQSLLPQFERAGIQVIGISLDLEVGSDRVRKFSEELGVTYPIYMTNASGMDEIFGEEVSIPLSLLVDGEGRVTKAFSGWTPQVKSQLLQLLTSGE